MEKISESGEEGTDIVVDVNDDKTSTVSTEKTPILKSQPRKSRSASVIDIDLMGHTNSLQRAYVRTMHLFFGAPHTNHTHTRARARTHARTHIQMIQRAFQCLLCL